MNVSFTLSKQMNDCNHIFPPLFSSIAFSGFGGKSVFPAVECHTTFPMGNRWRAQLRVFLLRVFFFPAYSCWLPRLFLCLLLSSAGPHCFEKTNMGACLWLSVKQSHINTGSLFGSPQRPWRRDVCKTATMLLAAITLTQQSLKV